MPIDLIIGPRWVIHQVELVEAAKSDDEKAHCMEDELYRVLLLAIGENRCDDPARCAKEALKTKEINFHRYCA